ncbi:hypothetical protein B0H14DRAFT_3885957 [Mycena olivaceomarginata]|nr:hypothetical protein B0H14DRAFT_3885957 [Mycena olivaceomarginata]
MRDKGGRRKWGEREGSIPPIRSARYSPSRRDHVRGPFISPRSEDDRGQLIVKWGESTCLEGNLEHDECGVGKTQMWSGAFEVQRRRIKGNRALSDPPLSGENVLEAQSRAACHFRERRLSDKRQRALIGGCVTDETAASLNWRREDAALSASPAWMKWVFHATGYWIRGAKCWNVVYGPMRAVASATSSSACDTLVVELVCGLPVRTEPRYDACALVVHMAFEVCARHVAAWIEMRKVVRGRCCCITASTANVAA